MDRQIHLFTTVGLSKRLDNKTLSSLVKYAEQSKNHTLPSGFSIFSHKAYLPQTHELSSVSGTIGSLLIQSATFTGAKGDPSAADLVPGSSGVTFPTGAGKVIVRITAGVTAIITQVNVPTPNTNNLRIIVTLAQPNGDAIVGPLWSTFSNPSIDFPPTVMTEGNQILITFRTSNNMPAKAVTLSVTACYTLTTPAPTAPPTPYVCPLAGGMFSSCALHTS